MRASAINITSFSTTFRLQSNASANTADGLTFVIQNAGVTALGAAGAGLGYQNIGTSVAVKFDLFSNATEGPDSTGLYTNGALPTNANSIDLSTSGVDLHSGHPMQVTLIYNGTTLSVTIFDTVTSQTATQNYTVNIPALVGANTAFVGFTGGTGGLTATQSILNWTFSPPASQSPAAPTGLGGQPTGPASIALTWTNNATNQTGYQLDRATNAAFTLNLVTQTLPSSPASFTRCRRGA